MRRSTLIVVTLGALFASLGGTSARAEGCTYLLGFSMLHALLPVQVGACVENEAHDAVTGDGLQHTAGGLLVWRKADNWTAFTDGYQSWINGPNGLVKRLNTVRFPWEANSERLPVISESGTSTDVAPAVGALPVPDPNVLYAAQGVSIIRGGTIIPVAGSASIISFVRNDTPSPITAYLSATLSDVGGQSVGKATGSISDVQPGEGRLAVLSSDASAENVAGILWHVDSVSAVPGLPQVITLTDLHPDPTVASRAFVTVKNNDAVSHSGALIVAISSATGELRGYATGAWNDLATGDTTMVLAVTPGDAISPTDQLVAQVTNLSRHLFTGTTANGVSTVYCDSDPAYRSAVATTTVVYGTLNAALAALPDARLHQPC